MKYTLNNNDGEYEVLLAHQAEDEVLRFSNRHSINDFLKEFSDNLQFLIYLEELYGENFSESDDYYPQSDEELVKAVINKIESGDIVIVDKSQSLTQIHDPTSTLVGNLTLDLPKDSRAVRRQEDWEIENPDHIKTLKSYDEDEDIDRTYKVVVEIVGQYTEGLNVWFELSKSGKIDHTKIAQLHHAGQDAHRTEVSMEGISKRKMHLWMCMGSAEAYSGNYQILLSNRAIPVNKDLQKHYWENILVPLLPLRYTTAEKSANKMEFLRRGWLYIYINGTIWREVCITNDNGLMQDVDLGLQAGKNKRPASAHAQTLLLLPLVVNNLEMTNVEICFSETQWTWDYICKMGGVAKDDERFSDNIFARSQQIKVDQRLRMARFQRLQIDSGHYQNYKKIQATAGELIELDNIPSISRNEKGDILKPFRNSGLYSFVVDDPLAVVWGLKLAQLEVIEKINHMSAVMRNSDYGLAKLIKGFINAERNVFNKAWMKGMRKSNLPNRNMFDSINSSVLTERDGQWESIQIAAQSQFYQTSRELFDYISDEDTNASFVHALRDYLMSDDPEIYVQGVSQWIAIANYLWFSEARLYFKKVLSPDHPLGKWIISPNEKQKRQLLMHEDMDARHAGQINSLGENAIRYISSKVLGRLLMLFAVQKFDNSKNGIIWLLEYINKFVGVRASIVRYPLGNILFESEAPADTFMHTSRHSLATDVTNEFAYKIKIKELTNRTNLPGSLSSTITFVINIINEALKISALLKHIESDKIGSLCALAVIRNTYQLDHLYETYEMSAGNPRSRMVFSSNTMAMFDVKSIVLGLLAVIEPTYLRIFDLSSDMSTAGKDKGMGLSSALFVLGIGGDKADVNGELLYVLSKAIPNWTDKWRLAHLYKNRSLLDELRKGYFGAQTRSLYVVDERNAETQISFDGKKLAWRPLNHEISALYNHVFSYKVSLSAQHPDRGIKKYFNRNVEFKGLVTFTYFLPFTSQFTLQAQMKYESGNVQKLPMSSIKFQLHEDGHGIVRGLSFVLPAAKNDVQEVKLYMNLDVFGDGRMLIPLKVKRLLDQCIDTDQVELA